ncbi:sigma-70 family RNA polymerase sigma factor [Candidatus Gracilibacteria bacterium]|nr:sigma-70 family RNA polymerase sigma factor [Candidatus Gracilibacteria bacterium]
MAIKDLNKEEVEALVKSAQEGNTEAFAKIYDMYVDAIFRYMSFKVGKEEALDLTENVFLKVWENIGIYRTGKYYFSAWIFKIAHNLVVDHYRLNRETLELSIDVPDDKFSSDPAAMAETGLKSEVLARAISKLKRTYQQVIVLKYINELENREIARIMGRGEGSLRILKFRALKALKLVLEEMGVKYH